MKKINMVIMKTILSLLFSLLVLGVGAQDLAVYEAYGPVKQIVWEIGSCLVPYLRGIHKFDKRGKESEFITRYFAERDRKGRMAREGMDPTDAYEWIYDSKGRVIQCNCLLRGDYEFFEFSVRLFYNENGEVKMYSSFDGQVPREFSNWVVVITKRDRHGNWIQRELRELRMGKDLRICRESRNIIYY